MLAQIRVLGEQKPALTSIENYAMQDVYTFIGGYKSQL